MKLGVNCLKNNLYLKEVAGNKPILVRIGILHISIVKWSKIAELFNLKILISVMVIAEQSVFAEGGVKTQ